MTTATLPKNSACIIDASFYIYAVFRQKVCRAGFTAGVIRRTQPEGRPAWTCTQVNKLLSLDEEPPSSASAERLTPTLSKPTPVSARHEAPAAGLGAGGIAGASPAPIRRPAPRLVHVTRSRFVINPETNAFRK
ncbi:MAG TPA: hypothetical protein VFY39_16125, partial [Gammaproteobacteria bacterium]|nr:hypothetical protein [Gammaproteobacteria bacterium]